ncbi:MAG: hypothetical protein FJ404_02375 [Verrucomicrobia bacterium]|nr:hypothetical protein [Verrucomicrobiota bacterium]
MSVPLHAERSALTEAQKAAFLVLLADEDPHVASAIRDRFLQTSLADSAWLTPHMRSSDPVLRRRSSEIIGELSKRAADRRFLAFCQHQAEGVPLEEAGSIGTSRGRFADADRLEEGLWLLAATRYPFINAEGYTALLDDYAREARALLPSDHEGFKPLAILNEILFKKHGYRGNEKNYYDAENSFLNRVLDRKTGNPISLCVLYFLVARRIGIPIIGIGMPGHFVCRYQTASEEIYVDCFNQGKLLTKADCVRFLNQTSVGFQEGFLAASSPRQILLRICTNLHQIYAQEGQSAENASMQRYILALAK